jgi:hypothetical protein
MVSRTLELRPLTTEEIPMTVITPMMIPSMVSAERILFFAMLSIAILTTSA